MSNNITESQAVLIRLGFSPQRGAHNARTIMLEELGLLISYIGNLEARKEEYAEAIKDANCLGKRSGKTRKLSARLFPFKPNIKWNKDRGKDVSSAPWYQLGLQYEGKEGDRINDHHLTLEEKKTA